ncbi:MAG: hypothetical protein O3B86_17075 [Planctomycetota bacterium]|nr:hypothetical protein [Planctomycetota bacterium]
MRLLDRLERKFRPFAVPNLTLIIVMGQSLAYILSQSDPRIIDQMNLLPRLVLKGEIWRLGSFCFVPPGANPLFFIFAMLIFHMMGSALERTWGLVRYNLFLLSGYIATVAVAFIYLDQFATNMFVGTSVFLAFAWLYPDYVFYIMFVLPVKVRWLALLTWIGLIYALLVGDMSTRLFVLAGIANFLLFFGDEVVMRMRSRKHRIRNKARTVIEARKSKHQCVVCGASDKSDPTLEFRYCSKCDGAPCYCETHIHDHEHIGNVEV